MKSNDEDASEYVVLRVARRAAMGRIQDG